MSEWDGYLAGYLAGRGLTEEGITARLLGSAYRALVRGEYEEWQRSRAPGAGTDIVTVPRPVLHAAIASAYGIHQPESRQWERDLMARAAITRAEVRRGGARAAGES